MELTSFEKASEMWIHLHTLDNQQNLAREFELERLLAESTQGKKSVGCLYSGLLRLWAEQDQIFAASISAAGLKDVMTTTKRTRTVQFLMKLRSEFEPLHASILNRKKLPALDEVVSEVLQEETRKQGMSFPIARSEIIVTTAMTRDVGTQHTPETQKALQLFDRNDIYKMIQDSLATALPNAISTVLTATYPGTTYNLDPFFDNVITSMNTISLPLPDQPDSHNISLNRNNQPPSPQNIMDPVRRSSRHTPPPSRYGYSAGEYGRSYALLTTLNSIVVPNTYMQASGLKCWEDAMNEELAALEKNDTWDMVDVTLLF
ncbi:hypothetical protein CQW23_00046 [Capsicum baccatum]|uniref:Uncharacterized protein n=1 Tax=Capsicum baccatum TaxID=33114 RepID=A0A2G2XJK4_CAPBA|nr:hypothetical protein CQW23_00046 [Capsicum baccatum]